jgi:hypothetical protein
VHVAVGGTDLAAAGDQHRQVFGRENLVGLDLMLAAIVGIRHGVSSKSEFARILVPPPKPVS